MRKMITRFFTIADYEDEEIWLREMNQNGWRLSGMLQPCFYFFEECEPEDVIYRLDYRNEKVNDEYLQIAKDFGWEYIAECMGWLYFRKSADSAESVEDEELFSDNASKMEMVEHIVKTRLMPLCIIFLCCIVPNLLRLTGGSSGVLGQFFTGFFAVMFVIYVYLIVHCGIKLKKLKDRFE